jgi:hypothetical protein
MTKVLFAAASLMLLTPNACEKDEPPRWRYTCGEPVCLGYTVKPGVPLCTGQVELGRCEAIGTTCDPQDHCNRLLACSVEEPGLLNCPDLP